MALVPISTQALSWAVAESGIPKAEIDKRLKVSNGTVDSWMGGDGQPNRTQFNRLKSLLGRPASIFFMDTPPTTTESDIAIRFAFGATSGSRSSVERLAIRDSSRIRRFVRDLQHDLGRRLKNIPTASTNEDPEDVARIVRAEHIRVPIEEQMSWSSPEQAFRQWRVLIERMDILVFLYSLGEESARGFSFAIEPPPVIGVSTTWPASVRVYTLFHELGHVLTQTSSSCVEEMDVRPTEDPIERWCEKFAASFLMPRHEIQELTAARPTLDSISTARWIANKLHVSRKSALLRLVETGSAQWDDFRRLDSKFEKRGRRGPSDPDHRRTRDVVRRDTYGSCLSSVLDAHRAGLVGEADIRTYLRMCPDELT